MISEFEPDLLSLARDDLKIWPRRLLHVRSMTSVERQDGNAYGKDVEPKFNILSYTWGRYEITQGPTLTINNISWRIPAIDSNYFTVTDFENVLQRVSQGVEYVWVDVACIDQENRIIKMDEIGKQAGIFNAATEAYIWLHRTSTKKLQGLISRLFDLVEELNIEDELEPQWEVADETDLGVEFVKNESFVPPCVKDARWGKQVIQIMATMYEDPWFSSLWTLQEIFLRPGAIILSKEGIQPEIDACGCVGFASVATQLAVIERVITNTVSHSSFLKLADQGLISVMKEVLELIAKIGLGAWDNPSTIYTSASFRRTKNPLDRIYGIMQVFGFCLGESATPGRIFSLEELEVQFAEAINARSPIWGQLFVHTSKAATGACWKVNMHSRLPQSLRFVITIPSSTCSISLDTDGLPIFQGSACSFAALAKHWEARAALGPKPSFWARDNVVQVIVLDATDFSSEYIPEALHDVQDEDFEKQRPLMNLLINHFGDELKVFKLGKLLTSEGDLEEEEWMVEGEDELDQTADVGLLVRPRTFNGETVMQRIGISVWTHLPIADFGYKTSCRLG